MTDYFKLDFGEESISVPIAKRGNPTGIKFRVVCNFQAAPDGLYTLRWNNTPIYSAAWNDTNNVITASYSLDEYLDPAGLSSGTLTMSWDTLPEFGIDVAVFIIYRY